MDVIADVIHSPNNPRVKLWASLLDRKNRDREALYLIEGIHLVKEALISGVLVETVVYSEERGLPEELEPHVNALISQLRIGLFAVSEAVLAKCTDTVAPQPVFAVVRKAGISVERVLQQYHSLVVVVDGVQDPGNLGTIVRSADAVGASAVLLGKGTVDLYNPKTIRSTMGSLFHLPIAECDLSNLLPKARERGVKVVVTRLRESVSCYEADYTGDTWFVVGNEGSGVSDAALHHADIFVSIPMAGRAESLNVAMATTVLLFEAMRQRQI